MKVVNKVVSARSLINEKACAGLRYRYEQSSMMLDVLFVPLDTSGKGAPEASGRQGRSA